jgi:hypothetical protein
MLLHLIFLSPSFATHKPLILVIIS